jgi:hypothetical protein
MRLQRWCLALALGLVAACSSDEPTDPGAILPAPRPETSLNFTRPTAGATLSVDSVRFWAVRGQNREVSWYYRPAAGSTDSVRFLRFRVRNDGLLRRPNGTVFANGDSVLITIRMRDFSRLIATFSPSGLVFDPSRPAELRLDFRNANQDFNRDGVVNQADSSLVSQFAIWKQETSGAPWQAVTSAVEVSSDFREVKADITSFTEYAIAW